MKTLNRPMFRYGGPIKEGIMDGMKSGGLANNEGPRRAALVGNPVYPKGPDGRTGHFIPAIIGGITAAARAAPLVYRGFKAARTFAPGNLGFMGRAKDMLLGSGRFRKTEVPFANVNKQTGKVVEGFKPGKDLSVLQALKDPQRLGAAIREYPFLTLSTPSLATSAVTGGGPIAIDAAKGIANFLVPGERFDPFKPKQPKVPEGDKTGLKRGTKEEGKTKVVPTPDVSGTGEGTKQEINEDRIQATKDRYYKLMGIDKMNKDAAYNSLIDASKIIQQEGGDLKGAIKSGSLQSQLIGAISKNLDKSSDLKKQIDAAVLKGEIEKDIKANDPSAAVDLAYKRAATAKIQKDLKGSSAADVLATAEISGKNLVTSNTLTSILQSKGTDVDFTFPDDKFQKWEKNNEGKDEIDYLTENYGGLDNGTYVVNKKAFKVQDGSVFPIDLDDITG